LEEELLRRLLPELPELFPLPPDFLEAVEDFDLAVFAIVKFLDVSYWMSIKKYATPTRNFFQKSLPI
jgi:hypothetical protein